MSEFDHMMTPITFKGCFGWLHMGGNAVAGDVAIVICPGLLRDALDAYHALRLMADAFAASGYPTLRFHYPGTGDSSDLGDQEAWSAWQQSIHDAANWLLSSTGAKRLIICGLRIGATLATLVAKNRDDVAGLLLLAPVVRGRSYIRQL